MPWSTKAEPDGGGVLLTAYRIGGTLAGPILSLLLKRRATQGKEDAARLGERFGDASLARPAGPVVWVHAASVGETNMMLPLVGVIGICCGTGAIAMPVARVLAGPSVARGLPTVPHRSPPTVTLDR